RDPHNGPQETVTKRPRYLRPSRIRKTQRSPANDVTVDVAGCGGLLNPIEEGVQVEQLRDPPEIIRPEGRDREAAGHLLEEESPGLEGGRCQIVPHQRTGRSQSCRSRRTIRSLRFSVCDSASPSASLSLPAPYARLISRGSIADPRLTTALTYRPTSS